MDITEVSIIHHVGIVFLLIWLLSSFNVCHPVVYFFCLIYLFLVHENFATRLRRKVRFEERRHAYQKRVLSDSESVRWMNHLVERMWPICMENVVSQRLLLPMMPWFLQKYKPWTVKEAMVQNLYMGRSPPMITEMRVCRQSTGDDHLVMEMGLNFRTADDMSAILAVKLTKRLGFGMSAKMHLTGMHVEGKVLVGIKFLPKWPFLGRMRVCFVEPPYFQMTVKPIFSHGLDVTEVPGIAGWLDKLLNVAFEETLVEPNMLVVDVEKFVSPEPESWFSMDAKDPVGYALVEIVEGSDMKPSDMNGLADPYIKGKLGSKRFRTKTQKKTLSPKWFEEFKIPIVSWDAPNLLEIEVRDKDRFVDDILGKCCVKINDFKDGERRDMWLPLDNVKTGRLHLAIKVIEFEGVDKLFEQPCDVDASKTEFKNGDISVKAPEKNKDPTADSYEPIDVEGQRETGIWVHHPGPEVAQVWEPRKGKNRVSKEGEFLSSSIKVEPYPNDSSSTDESLEGNKPKSRNPVKRGFHKVGSLFSRSPKTEDDKDKSRSIKIRDDEDCDTPHENVRSVNAKGIGVNLVMEDNHLATGQNPKVVEFEESPEGSELGSPDKRGVRGTVKGILKSTGHSARGMMHAMSRKGSMKRKDKDLSVQSDSSGEAGSITSPGYRPDSEAGSEKAAMSPGEAGSILSPGYRLDTEAGSEKAAMSPVTAGGEVNVEEPDRLSLDAVDVNAIDKGDKGQFDAVDISAIEKGQFDDSEITGQVISSSPK